MIYIEQDSWSTWMFKVDKVRGYYYGWSEHNTWEGDDYILYHNEGDFTQTFLAPSILDRW